MRQTWQTWPRQSPYKESPVRMSPSTLGGRLSALACQRSAIASDQENQGGWRDERPTRSVRHGRTFKAHPLLL
jgi:hypothetical protein